MADATKPLNREQIELLRRSMLEQAGYKESKWWASDANRLCDMALRALEYVNSGDSKLSNKERGYLLRLKDRAETLRARTKSTINTPVVIAAAMELHAIEWAINKLDISPLPHSQEKPCKSNETR